MTGKSTRDEVDELLEGEQLVLSDLVNRVLDKGVVIASHITIGVADIDLIQLDLKLLISSVAALQKRAVEREKLASGDVSVRPPARP